MGRSASHIALECALKTQANITLISEEVAAEKKTLQEISEEIATVIKRRAESGKRFGVVLIPEGLIEFIPEMKTLIVELNDLLAKNSDYFESLKHDEEKHQFVNKSLSAESSHAFSSLPWAIQMQLLADRDPHGNVQVSRIETEKLLIDIVGDILREWKARGEFDGSFSTQPHFFGYEGRCAAPSNYDADYCYSLGYTAATLIGGGKTGYLASVRNTTKSADQWSAGGIPLTMIYAALIKQTKRSFLIDDRACAAGSDSIGGFGSGSGALSGNGCSRGAFNRWLGARRSSRGRVVAGV